MSIITNKLTKIFGTQTAVNEISFSIKKGEIVGFLGPNGAGKSTTMKMLTGYIPPSSGSGSICDLDIIENTLEIKARIGYLPEHNPLYLDMYVKEFLHFAANMVGIKKPQNEIKRVIEQTGLGKEQHKLIGQLSKGYRQRVGLAQAIIHNPEVLILDEPTGGLDPNQVIEIRQLIKNLGKTTLLSSHIMQEVEAICSRAIIIDKGNIVADNAISALQSTNVQTIKVQFAEKINRSDLEILPGVNAIKALENHTYLIETNNADTRKAISHYALKNNLEILELSSQTVTLEQIFQDLTK